ncbi:MAG: GspH/FimT family pseudopilin [Wenzhouxiangella sp.]
MSKSTIAATRQAGVTLFELMIAIAVLAVLLATAVPSIQEVLKNNRLAAQNNEMVALVNLARSQAIRRNANVSLELAPNGSIWEAHVRVPGAPPDDSAGCPQIPDVIRCSDHSNVVLTADPTILTFNNRGFLEQASGDWEEANLTLVHENCSGLRQARRVRVLPTGQVTSMGIACPET